MTFHARARNIIFPNSFYVKFYNSINSGMHITHKKGEKLCRVSFISFHKYIKRLFRCLILSKDPQQTIIEPREIQNGSLLLSNEVYVIVNNIISTCIFTNEEYIKE